MVNVHLDALELELRKLDGVRTVGFTRQHDVLYIQLFLDATSSDTHLPFEATRIASRYSHSPVAVEIVRWSNPAPTEEPVRSSGLASIFENTSIIDEPAEDDSFSFAGSIARTTTDPAISTEVERSLDKLEMTEEPLETTTVISAEINTETPAIIPSVAEGSHETTEEIAAHDSMADEGYDDSHDIREEPSDYIDLSTDEEEKTEVDLTEDFFTPEEHDDSYDDADEIALLLVTTSPHNDEIEVHLSFDHTRTIGRAPTNRGLLGAIDATVDAITQLTGSDEFHAEWARSLEPGAEHASLVAVGLTNNDGSDSRHGIAGGVSPIEAAARATLNALSHSTLASS